MTHLIALFIVIFSSVGVCKDEFKEVLPVQNHAAETALQLTQEEHQWLTQHKTIRVAYDGSLPPYSFVNDQGKIDGIAFEIMALLSQRFGVDFTIYPDSNWGRIYKAGAKRKVDMIATMVNRADRAEWFSFTKPYLTKSLVIVTKQDNTVINNRNDLADKKIAVIDGYQYGEQVSKEFPKAKLVKAKSVKDSLIAVEKGQADAAILFLGTANYLQAKYQLTQLKTAAFYDRNSADESIAVRKDWPILVGILQKGLDSLTEGEVQKIFTKWVVHGGVASIADNVTKKAPLPIQPIQPITKTVVEIEQQPANFSAKKIVVAPKVEAQKTAKSPEILLFIAALLGLWLYVLLKQKKQLLQSKNDVLASTQDLRTAHNNPTDLPIGPTSEISGDQPKAESQLESNGEFDIENPKIIHAPQLGIPVDETISYQRDAEGQFSYVSPSVNNLLGYTETDFMENYGHYLTDNPVNHNLDSLIEACIQGTPTETYEIEIFDAGQGIHWLEVNDTPIYDGQGHCIGIEGVMRDITAQRLDCKLSDKSTLGPEVATEAYLPESLQGHLKQAIYTANKNQKPFALIYLTLDRLRHLDGSFVVYFNDQVFSEANKRLRSTLRDTDTVVDLDVDKFAMILPDTNAQDASLITDKIRKILQIPYLVGVQTIVLDTNVGIAIYPDHGIEPAFLISKAQDLSSASLTEITGIKNPVAYDILEEESLRLQQDLVLVLDECKVSLRATSPNNINALHRHSQFSVYYQSRHCLKDYSIVGFEALIRWQHPDLGLLLPKGFVGLVQDIGLLDVMTYWIIQQVSFQAMVWEKDGLRPALMAINLDDLTSKQAVEVAKITNIVEETGAKPEWLAFSIPEHVLAKHPDVAIPIIDQLVAAGFTVAIDDFGSDSSLLAQLKAIPAQIIEFDSAFIRSLPGNTADAEIIDFSIAMLHDLGKTVIAKEIETEQQLEFLKTSGCDVIQGHILSRPLPAKEAKELIENLPDFAWYLKQ